MRGKYYLQSLVLDLNMSTTKKWVYVCESYGNLKVGVFSDIKRRLLESGLANGM